MLVIKIPKAEYWDDRQNVFVYTKAQELQLEHSLVSLSKWESKWGKAFLGKQQKTDAEVLDYVKCMTITQNVEDEVYNNLTLDNYNQINAYIVHPMSATHIREVESGPKSGDTVTSELIYYWMISLNIPFECQKWHLNRLLNLIKVCNVKNNPPKSKNQSEMLKRNAAMNASRKAKFNTTG